MRRLLPLVLALVILAGLVPALETPALAAESDALIKVSVSNLYDLIVNPYRMAVETQGGTVTSDSIASDPCLITSETAAALVISATAYVTVQGSVKVALEPIERAGNDYAKSVFLFLELKKLDSGELEGVAWTKSADFESGTSCVQILQSGSGTATVTVPDATDGPTYAAFKISGDCSYPDGTNPWVTVAQNEGDVVDGFSVTVTFSFSVEAYCTVRYHFWEHNYQDYGQTEFEEVAQWRPIYGTWDDVGVFVNGEKVEGSVEDDYKEYNYNVGEDIVVKVIADVYRSDELSETSGEPVMLITEISYDVYEGGEDDPVTYYIYSNDSEKNPDPTDTNAYITYEGKIEPFTLDKGETIDMYILIERGQVRIDSSTGGLIPWEIIVGNN